MNQDLRVVQSYKFNNETKVPIVSLFLKINVFFLPSPQNNFTHPPIKNTLHMTPLFIGP